MVKTDEKKKSKSLFDKKRTEQNLKWTILKFSSDWEMAHKFTIDTEGNKKGMMNFKIFCSMTSRSRQEIEKKKLISDEKI